MGTRVLTLEDFGGGGALSDMDICEPPEPFEVSLREAIQIIWVKLSQLEQGMGPAGTPIQDSHPCEPWDSTPQLPHMGHTDTPLGLHPGHPFPGGTPGDSIPGLDKG